MSFATPPFQAPDEHQHFFRAFQLSEGTFRGETLGKQSGGSLPASLGGLADAFLGSRATHLETREIKAFPARATWMRLGDPLILERRAFIDFTGAAPYAPLAYLPQIIGIELGRSLGAGPLALLYLARGANALAAAGLMAAAGLIIPYGRVLLIGSSLLPMSLALFGSVSPDASLIGCCFLFCAIASRASVSNRWSVQDVALACVAGAVVCTIKPVYAPMLLLGLPAALRAGARRNILAAHATILAIVGGASALWQGVIAVKASPMRDGVDPAAQIAGLLAHLSELPLLLLGTLEHFWLLWGLQLIGRLGWANVALPLWMYGLALVALVGAVASGSVEDARPSRTEAVWALVLTGGCFVLILIALDVIWTPVGSQIVEGVQGRYFLPLLATMIGACSRLRLPNSDGRASFDSLVLGAFALEAVATAPVILSTYRVI